MCKYTSLWQPLHLWERWGPDEITGTVICVFPSSGWSWSCWRSALMGLCKKYVFLELSLRLYHWGFSNPGRCIRWDSVKYDFFEKEAFRAQTFFFFFLADQSWKACVRTAGIDTDSFMFFMLVLWKILVCTLKSICTTVWRILSWSTHIHVEGLTQEDYRNSHWILSNKNRL